MPHLLPIWRLHTHRRLVEPFCGGLAVTLGLQPVRAYLNDANPHLVHFYQWIQRGLRRRDVRMENDETVYYANRDRFNELVRSGRAGTEEAATLFYYLNRTGYNGLCRFNSRGEFNVPFGRYSSITYARTFTAHRRAFANWEFNCGDFADVRLQDDDFVYADPPYDVEFTAYSRGGFSWDDQARTAKALAEHSGPVILVNQSTPRIVRLYRDLGYSISYLDAPRRISCDGNRTPAKEVFATRNL